MDSKRRALQFGDKLWLPDSYSSSCMVCMKPFIIFTRRRHHCRSCGKIVCHACSPGTLEMLVKYAKTELVKAVRVCIYCHEPTTSAGHAVTVFGGTSNSKTTANADINQDFAGITGNNILAATQNGGGM